MLSIAIDQLPLLIKQDQYHQIETNAPLTTVTRAMLSVLLLVCQLAISIDIHSSHAQTVIEGAVRLKS